MQDMANYGLAAVYTAGDTEAKRSMASTLVETLTAAAAPPVTAATTSASTSSSKPGGDAAAVRPCFTLKCIPRRVTI